MRALPISPLVLVGLCALASGPFGLGGALGFERAAILDSLEVWRVVTGQLIHGTPELFCVDVGSVLCLAWLVERRQGAAAVWVVALLSAVAAGVGTLLLRPEIQTLEGASGMASGLFGFLAVDLFVRGGARQRWLAVGAAGLFAVKLALESAAPAGRSWWLDGEDQLVVVAAAHGAGAAAGAAVHRVMTLSARFMAPMTSSMEPTVPTAGSTS